MRRFAFRAWNKKKNAWQHKEPCDILGEMILLGGWMSHVSILDLNEIVVMQFTGLRDKKGKEIYEGDLVKSEIHNPSIFEVEFIEGGFCCTYENSIPIDINHFFPSVGCQLEVIGNIYDNPDLKKSTPSEISKQLEKERRLNPCKNCDTDRTQCEYNCGEENHWAARYSSKEISAQDSV